MAHFTSPWYFKCDTSTFIYTNKFNQYQVQIPLGAYLNGRIYQSKNRLQLQAPQKSKAVALIE